MKALPEVSPFELHSVKCTPGTPETYWQTKYYDRINSVPARTGNPVGVLTGIFSPVGNITGAPGAHTTPLRKFVYKVKKPFATVR